MSVPAVLAREMPVVYGSCLLDRLFDPLAGGMLFVWLFGLLFA